MKVSTSFLGYYVRFSRKFWEDFTDWPRDNVIVAGIAAVAPPLALYLRNPHQDIDWGLIRTTLLIYVALLGIYIIVRAVRVPWKLDQEREDTALRINAENKELLEQNKELKAKLQTRGTPEPLKHNVQCVGFKHVVFDPLLPELTAATLSYQNVPIIGEEIGEFYNARLKVSFHSDGEDVAIVFPAKWIDSDSSAITIDVIAKSAIIASCIAGRWGADRLIDPDRGWVYNNVESVKLPVGRIEIIATLFGQSNLSVPPTIGVLTLGEDGSASFTKTQS
jgi:hypothetical protein